MDTRDPAAELAMIQMGSRFTAQIERKVALRLDTSDEQTWIDTFEIGYHIPPTIMPSAVLDLGANIGLTAAHYASMWPEATIVAVEMDISSAKLCRYNFSGKVVTTAVGAISGNGSYENSGGEDSYSLTRPGNITTPIVTITDLIDAHLPTATVVFCKMDIEGSEWEIMARGVDKRVGWLLVELHGELPADEMIVDGTRLLQDDGFAVEQHEIHPHALWAVRQ